MLRAIHLENFRAFGAEQQRIDCSPITVITGPNGSGKSTILQAVSLLAQTAKGGDSQRSGFVWRGDFTDLSEDGRLAIYRRDEGRGRALRSLGP